MLTLEEIEASTDLTGKIPFASAVFLKKIIKTFNMHVDANTFTNTVIPYQDLEIDPSKIVYCDVYWANSVDNDPLLFLKYLQNGYLYNIQHKWSAEQNVAFSLLIVARM